MAPSYDAVAPAGGEMASSGSGEASCGEDAESRTGARDYLRVGYAVSALVCGAVLSVFAAPRGGFGGVGGGGALVSSLSGMMTQQKMKQRQFIKVFTWNDYTDSLGPAGADYPWVSEGGYAAVVEPHKEHHFRACALKRTQQGRMGESQCVSDMTLFSWSVDGQQTSSIMGGAVFTHVFSSLGAHEVVAVETKSEEGSALPDEEGDSTQAVRVVCKYVRRELRDLSVADREAFLDAAAVLWRVGSVEGQRQYGSAYAPISTFVATHARLAGDACCDHMHDGCGFVTQHSALSLSFEGSLQAVDGSVSLPYWDYSIDVERVYRDHGGDFGKFVDSDANEL